MHICIALGEKIVPLIIIKVPTFAFQTKLKKRSLFRRAAVLSGINHHHVAPLLLPTRRVQDRA